MKTLDNISKKGPITGLLAGMLGASKILSPSPIKEWFKVLEKDILDKEVPSNLSLKNRMEAYLNGFTRKRYCWYDLKNSSDLDLYLNDFTIQLIRTKVHKNSKILSDKELFFNYFKEKGLVDYSPKLYSVIKSRETDGYKKIDELSKKKDKVVLKPLKGKGGKQIYVFEKIGENFLVNDEYYKSEEVKSLIQSFNDYILTEYCDQAPFLKRIYPGSANTLRALTIYQNKAPRIVHSFLRIGTEKSGVVDNMSQGGLTAEINMRTGELSKGAEFLSSGKVKWHDKHPDTQKEIRGTVIPNWNKIKDKMLDLFSDLDDFNCVVWDVLLTGEEDFVILEGNNNCPTFRGHQIHTPLLKIQDFRNFLATKNILSYTC